MTAWKYQMGIHDLLSDEVVEGPEFEAVRDAVVAKIKQAPDYTRDYRVAYDLQDIAEAIAQTENTDDFNDALDRLYDWGDENTVWIG
jgi:hypothetical protein